MSYKIVCNSNIVKYELQNVLRLSCESQILTKIPKLALGEMCLVLFESQRVNSKKIETSSFKFEYSNLSSALDVLV